MKGGTLVELTSEILAIEHALMEADGELPPEIETQLDLAQGNLAEKVDRYRYIIEALESRAKYFAEIEKQMKGAKKVFENQRDRLRERLRFAIKATGGRELAGHDWRYLLSPGKDKLVIDEEKLAPEYLRERIVKEPDRDHIEDVLRCGFDLEGVTVEKVETLRCYVNAAGRAREVKGKAVDTDK